ncbi:MAG: HigA family addiction module antidote protein [Rhodospirillales bacterium]|nr:HigA family addiction module antidote protein [Rhodospirillales bacterium]
MMKTKRRPTPPGIMLRDMYLKPRKITVTAFAAAVGCSRKHMSDIINERARIDAVLAARIARVLDTSTVLWLNLQAGIDAWDGEQAIKRWKPAMTFGVAGKKAA